MWNRDGWDASTRLGVLTAHAAVGAESELEAMAPETVTIHATRVPFGGMAAGGEMEPTIPISEVRSFADPPQIDDAAELLAAAPIDAIGCGFTASAYALGADGEAAMLARLEARSGEIPVTATASAAAAALRRIGVDRVALVHPPWFDTELSLLGGAYFEGHGFEVVISASAELPSEQRLIEPAALFEWVRANTPDAADGVFIGGNGFRSVGVIQALEADLGRPVVTANQALLWRLLGLAGSGAVVKGYGRLLELPLA
jgi:maleate isomerase